MSKIAFVLKEEIARLARKEVNSQTQALRKASAQHRREIAQLKREAGVLSKQVTFLERQERKRAESAVPVDMVKGKRFSPRGLKTHREKLGLSATDYAKLIGVSEQTIYNWEQGKSKPRNEHLGPLVAVRDLGKREAAKRLELLEG